MSDDMKAAMTAVAHVNADRLQAAYELGRMTYKREVVAKLRHRHAEYAGEARMYGQGPAHHARYQAKADQVWEDMTWIEGGCK